MVMFTFFCKLYKKIYFVFWCYLINLNLPSVYSQRLEPVAFLVLHKDQWLSHKIFHSSICVVQTNFSHLVITQMIQTGVHDTIQFQKIVSFLGIKCCSGCCTFMISLSKHIFILIPLVFVLVKTSSVFHPN